MRRAAKVDANQSEIVAALEKAGASVTSLAAVGKGVPDLLVAYRGCWYLLEIKNPERSRKRRGFLATQAAWSDGQRAPVRLVMDVDDALRAVGAVTDGGSQWALQNVS